MIPTSNLINAAIIMAIISVMCWAQDDDARADANTPDVQAIAEQEDADALNSREWAGQQVCGPDRTAVWDDDKSLRCLRNVDAPRTVTASGVQQ
ncbi:hypothetical protein [Diaphorobacter caeni]|uniref:hypothetical protein n=1 Tax=Diaphorobacter caeni TaxID=2784387 RepID=UPI00188E1F22|nr:hypothetical protein [Diaphorobacter caeni]MBF5006884.1 hypothetical protein [Diaphorobacter caeni]